MSNTSIQLKKSGISGNTPVDLVHGEVALNYADGKLYYKSDFNDIRYITNQDSFSTINVDNVLLIATSPTDILSISPGNNISFITDTLSKTITFDVDNSANRYANAAFIQANAAFNKANTGSGSSGGFPFIDLGYIYESISLNANVDCGVLA